MMDVAILLGGLLASGAVLGRLITAFLMRRSLKSSGETFTSRTTVREIVNSDLKLIQFFNNASTQTCNYGRVNAARTRYSRARKMSLTKIEFELAPESFDSRSACASFT